MTAADPHESSYACYYDDSIGAYLGDVFSVNWMEDSDVENLKSESINHQFEIIRSETKESHVEEYGDLDIGSTKLVDVLGSNVDFSKVKSKTKKWRQRRINDAVASQDVPIAVLQKKLQRVGNFQKQDLKLTIDFLNKKRKMLDELFDRLLNYVTSGDQSKENELRDSKHSLDNHNFYCYKTIFKHFSKKCLKIAKNPYVAVHLQKFVNFCGLPWGHMQDMLTAIESECAGFHNELVDVQIII